MLEWKCPFVRFRKDLACRRWGRERATSPVTLMDLVAVDRGAVLAASRSFFLLSFPNFCLARYAYHPRCGGVCALCCLAGRRSGDWTSRKSCEEGLLMTPGRRRARTGCTVLVAGDSRSTSR